MIVIILVALLNALTCDGDWHASRDRENWDGCKVTSYCVWRYQQPETMRCLDIEDPSKACRLAAESSR